MSTKERLRLFRRLLTAPPEERRALLGIASRALVIEVALRTQPLPRVCRLLGIRLIDKEAEVDKHGTRNQQHAHAKQTSSQVAHIDRVLRHWPLGGGCLRRSLLLGWYQRSDSPTLLIGVRASSNAQRPLDAHAWLDGDGSMDPNPGFRVLRSDAP